MSMTVVARMADTVLYRDDDDDSDNTYLCISDITVL